MTELNLDESKRLVSFIGYGNPAAPLRFMGAEEGLGGAMSSKEKAENLRARCAWGSIVDLRDAHLTLKENGRFIDISNPRSGSTTVWRFMARIALAVEGSAEFNVDEAVTAYVRHKLGRSEGKTFLTELSPIPLRRSQRRDLVESMGGEELTKLFEARRLRQLELLTKSPGVLICFGLGKRKQFADHLELHWQPLYERIWWNSDRKAFLLPFFGNGQLSKEDIARFVSSRAFLEAVQN